MEIIYVKKKKKGENIYLSKLKSQIGYCVVGKFKFFFQEFLICKYATFIY